MNQSWLMKIKNRLVNAWKTADEVARYKACDRLEDEVEEMEYIFGILCQGAFNWHACPAGENQHGPSAGYGKGAHTYDGPGGNRQ